ncbi:MAG: 4Fe-4S binding protein, partial [Chloroflexi bacterium]|nr:4Fe-4S binding protein [Chloroflexota bacterium]
MNHPDACIQCGTCVTVCPVEKVGGHAIVTFLADPDATGYS